MKKLTVLAFCLITSLLSAFSPVSVRAAPVTDVLAAALAQGATEVDMTFDAIPVSDIGRILADVLHEDPALFHVAPTLSYRYDGQGRVLTLYPVYTLQGEALTAARHLYAAAIHRLCAGVDPAWGEADKALYLHDLLARQYTYDTNEQNYDAYRFFRDGRGVCQAYALAFSAVARHVGLAVDLVYSDAMDHAWNHVRVDGAWYHVDVTRDDPTDGDSDTVLHRRFLRSDAGMATLGYRDYTCIGGHVCDSARYEGPDRQGRLEPWQALPFRLGETWCFVSEDGTLTPISLAHAPTVYDEGDVTTDGVLALDDLLFLRIAEADIPPAATDALREQLIQQLLMQFPSE